MKLEKLFISAIALSIAISGVAQEGSGGCPACVVIQSQQRSDVEVGFAELTVPKGQLSWFTIGSGASEENRFRTFIKTGVTDRFDMGVGYSHYGQRATLQLTYQMARQDERTPISLLVGYGFSSTYTRAQEGAYLMGVRTDGNLSLMAGWQRLRNGRDIGFIAANYRLDPNTALMFYSHQGTMPGEPTLYNLALVRRFGDWNLGVWWFHPTAESDVGFSVSRSFTLR
ncbi:MAG: hypothetical protein KatS3mg020_0789 [Fimbriimonadales bacterium]|nr:MAG: hypothetical protein KatS3mg020_0789 [Fimbriimonadales bacterium]